MYVPKHFALTERRELIAFVREHPFGVLVSAYAGVPAATHVPFVLLEPDGEHPRLGFHLAAANPQAHALDGSSVLAVFQGAHAHVSASWYEHPERSVPTWNYSAVHCAGVAALAGEERTGAILQATSAEFEGSAWSMERADPAYLETMKRGILGFELAVSAITGAKKFSQNRTPGERERIVRELEASGSPLGPEMRAYYRSDFST